MRSLYRDNAFFLLNATADEPLKDLTKRQKRLEVSLEMGESLSRSILPFLASQPLSREELSSAVQRLQNGRLRLNEEVHWVHAGPGGDGLPNAALPPGDFLRFFNQRIAVGGLRGALAKHNYAVVLHAFAIEHETGNGISRETLGKVWHAAHKGWRETVSSGEFWAFLSERVDSWADPTVSESDVDTARRAVGQMLVKVQEDLAIGYIHARQYDRLGLHASLIREACSWVPGGPSALTRITSLLTEEAQQEIAHILNELDGRLEGRRPEEQKQVFAKAEKQLRAVATNCEKALPLVTESKDATDSIGDAVAVAFRGLSIRQFNTLEVLADSRRLLAAAEEFARTPSTRSLIETDQRYLEFRRLRDTGVDAANENRHAEALRALEAALPLAPDGERVQVSEWIETCRRNRVLDGVDTNKRSPTLHTINGIGAMFYGTRDSDAATRSYVTTHFFTFFFIPLIPLGAYRVIASGPSSYQIFGRVPLSQAASWYRRIVFGAAAILFLIAIASSNGPSGSGGSDSRGYTSGSAPGFQPTPAPGAYQADPTPTPSGFRSTPTPPADHPPNLALLRSQIEARKTALDAENRRLDSLSNQIDSLKARISMLERSYQSSPSDFVYSDYQVTRDRHNLLVEQHNSLLAELRRKGLLLQQDIDDYNRQVNSR